MALFQTSVVNKYLAELDKALLEKQYALYKNYFLNSAIQKNILASKEEEFQEGFLRELLVKVLGYTINPDADYNLKTELKNVKDSKKADGAIVDNEKVLAVIELKGTDTINLNQVEIQAFNYKNNQEGCRYVITSNFQKLRFYIDNAIEHLEWDLFKLDYEGFKFLYLCLSKETLFKNYPAKIKEESLSQEESITKKLYKEYSNFRKALFNNIADNNPQFDKLLLFKKTQKLLDRFLFLFFAEDRNLLPPNSVRKILDQWTKLKEEYDEYQALYERFKKYFGYLNTGYIGKTHEIFAYNGGLFAQDEVLDTIKIDDATLYEATLNLSRYDYNSDVDVNILGHIFEHSLTEIEELEAEIILGEERVNVKTSKRKKDGVFYTPKYITKYIVENTLGILCANKKIELQITEEDYHPLQKKNTVKKIFDKLTNYRNWLLQVTILDPACGSGAFLNQALEFLIAEHKLISELEANITGSSIVFDVENSILENNLFGVDINEESVEIAKLSLWLRTARKGRKLNNLNNNIKCGNSLIDDITVAGDKAFNWQKEFPQIFGEHIETDVPVTKKVIVKKEVAETSTKPEQHFNTNNDAAETNVYNREQITNDDNAIVNTDFNIVNEPAAKYHTKTQANRGFDVVIGNPPYVDMRSINSNDIKYFKREYKSASDRINLFGLFVEHSLKIMKDGSYYGMIIHRNLIRSNEYEKCRELILDKTEITSILSFKNGVFDGVTGEMTVLTFKKSEIPNKNNEIEIYNFEKNINDIISKSIIKQLVFHKCIGKRFNVYLNYDKSEILLKISKEKILMGTISYTLQGIIAGDEKRFISNQKISEEYMPIVRGRDINRYSTFTPYEFIYFIEGTKVLTRSRKRENFEVENKILTQHVSGGIKAFLDNDSLYYMQTINGTIITNKKFSYKYILSLLNSKLINFYYENIFNIGAEFTTAVAIENLDLLPIHEIGLEGQWPLIEKVDTMLFKNKELQAANRQFTQLLLSKFPELQINTKLDKWFTLNFTDFSKELDKQKIKLTLQQESEWLIFFEQEKQKALAIKNEIDTTDAAIDKMVYALYELTEEAIKIIEQE